MKSQYNQAVKALKELGIKQIPKLENIKLSKEHKKLIKDRNAVLVLSPEINKDFTFKDLIDAFDKKQTRKTYVWDDLWNQYDLTAPARASLVLMDAENDYDEEMLFFTNQTLEEQRRSIKESGFEAVNPVEYLMLQTILRPKYLNAETWLRFVGLENKTVGGDSFVGFVRSLEGELDFYGSRGYSDSVAGVGLSAGLGSQPLELSPSFSLPDKLKINGEIYLKQ